MWEALNHRFNLATTLGLLPRIEDDVALQEDIALDDARGECEIYGVISPKGRFSIGSMLSW
jgi:hypothetical protein